MQNNYLLRVEGTNLDSFVFDTEDLSTARGGSLLLLKAVEELDTKVKDLMPVATGASIGIFKITSDKPVNIKSEVEKYLKNSATDLAHATFVVDIIEWCDGEDYGAVAQKLLTLNRWRQMQSPSFAIPSLASTEGACEIDRVRPAQKLDCKGADVVMVSNSVFARRKFGKDEKQKFYKKETGICDLPEFVYEFDELTNDQTNNNDKGFLHHKMAVIYIDGNGFGKIKERYKDDGDEKKFSDDLKNNRRAVLKYVLKEAVADNYNWQFEGKGRNGGTSNKIRMETLIWGGDEVLWVVPAWVGWWTLAAYYEKSSAWTFGGEPLKHAAGIVFCHYNAPIKRVKQLAHDLAEFGKNDRTKNLFTYQILESFDHAGVDLEAFLKGRLINGMSINDLIMDGNKMSDFSSAMKTIKQEFPKRKLFQIVHEFRRTPSVAREIITSVKGDLDEDVKSSLNDVFEALSTSPDCPSGWFHVLELWDYVGLD